MSFFMGNLFNFSPASKLFKKKKIDIDVEKVEAYLAKVEKPLDDWATEQGKKVVLTSTGLIFNKKEPEYWPGKPKEFITKKKCCDGCGAPINKGIKCIYCGTHYIEYEPPEENDITAESTEEDILDIPIKSYADYWKEIHNTRRTCK